MKKVIIVHGFGASPNGGWRSWLMSELNTIDIWAIAIALPTPDKPICTEWINELNSHVQKNKNDELYLVGHSLGSTTILRYLESTDVSLSGVVLVSGPCENLGRAELENFLDRPFDFETIKTKAQKFAVIHGDNDDRVPLSQGEKIAKELGVLLVVVENGGHLNGRSGWNTLPQCLEVLRNMFA